MTNMTEAMSPTYKRPRSLERILHSRGVIEPEPITEASGDIPPKPQAAYTESGGKLQHSFSVALASGEMHGFHYFNVDNLTFKPGRKGDYLSFDHRGKVVVVRGRGLQVIYHALIGQVLMEVRELEQHCSNSRQVSISRIDITPL